MEYNSSPADTQKPLIWLVSTHPCTIRHFLVTADNHLEDVPGVSARCVSDESVSYLPCQTSRTVACNLQDLAAPLGPAVSRVTLPPYLVRLAIPTLFERSFVVPPRIASMRVKILTTMAILAILTASAKGHFQLTRRLPAHRLQAYIRAAVSIRESTPRCFTVAGSRIVLTVSSTAALRYAALVCRWKQEAVPQSGRLFGRRIGGPG